MKFVQTGDIHTGECRSLDGYLSRHRSVLYQIRNICVDRKLPLVVAGDLFHSKKTDYQERFLIDEWLGDLERDGILTIIISGNHDHLFGDITQLYGYKRLPFKHIKVVDWDPETVIVGDTGFICIPWRGYKTEEIENIVYKKLPEVSGCKHKVIVLHECLMGAFFDNNMPSDHGLVLPKIDDVTYWAVGDIHSKQKAGVNNGFYAGAPAQFKFGDKPDKGVLIVDLDKPTAPEFVPIVSKPLVTISSVKEISGDAYYKVEGDFEEVIKANRDSNVVRTEWNKSKEKLETYEKIGIYDGLPEFLSEYGIDKDYQEMAISWVKALLK